MKMEKRHDDMLTTRLETVLNVGVAHILWKEMYMWYDVKKIAVRTLRNLTDRWEDLTEGEHGKLMQVRGSEGIFLMAEKSIEPIHAPEDE